jgi:hypothetical protein
MLDTPVASHGLIPILFEVRLPEQRSGEWALANWARSGKAVEAFGVGTVPILLLAHE